MQAHCFHLCNGPCKAVPSLQDNWGNSQVKRLDLRKVWTDFVIKILSPLQPRFLFSVPPHPWEISTQGEGIRSWSLPFQQEKLSPYLNLIRALVSQNSKNTQSNQLLYKTQRKRNWSWQGEFSAWSLTIWNWANPSTFWASLFSVGRTSMLLTLPLLFPPPLQNHYLSVSH